MIFYQHYDFITIGLMKEKSFYMIRDVVTCANIYTR